MKVDDWWYLDKEGYMRYAREVKEGEGLWTSEMGMHLLNQHFKRLREENESSDSNI